MKLYQFILCPDEFAIETRVVAATSLDEARRNANITDDDQAEVYEHDLDEVVYYYFEG